VKVVTISDFRANIARMFDAITTDDEVLVVTRSGQEPMVVMTKTDYDALQTTQYLLSGDNGRVLRRRIAEMEAGKGVEHELIDYPEDDTR
jgi:antitoxin YefM